MFGIAGGIIHWLAAAEWEINPLCLTSGISLSCYDQLTRANLNAVYKKISEIRSHYSIVSKSCWMSNTSFLTKHRFASFAVCLAYWLIPAESWRCILKVSNCLSSQMSYYILKWKVIQDSGSLWDPYLYKRNTTHYTVTLLLLQIHRGRFTKRRGNPTLPKTDVNKE